MKQTLFSIIFLSQSCSSTIETSNPPPELKDVSNKSSADMQHDRTSSDGGLDDRDILFTDLIADSAPKTSSWDLEKTKYLKKRFISGANPRLAQCNDGTPAVMYYRIHNPNAPYVLFLEGGGLCNTEKSCDKRKQNNPQYLTSNSTLDHPVPDQIFGGGIVSSALSKNPHYSEMNQIRLRYCSSDLWSGTHQGSDPRETIGIFWAAI